MATLKVVFLSGNTEKLAVYGHGMKHMWQMESQVLDRLSKVKGLKLDTAKIRKYWIDEEGDHIDIVNDTDFDFLLKRIGNGTTKIFFEVRYPPSLADDTDNLTMHTHVQCNVCETKPVLGMRYKCLECDDFDLCMDCEGEMRHPDHLMMRIPNSDRYYKLREQIAKEAATAKGATNDCLTAAEFQTDEESRYRNREWSAGPGIWTKFSDMMKNLAEVGAAVAASQQEQEAPAVPSAPIEASQNITTTEAPVVAEIQTEQMNIPLDHSSAETQTLEMATSAENLQNFMKLGMQILRNFNHMFGKILDTVPAPSVEESPLDSAPEPVVIDINMTNGNNYPSATTQLLQPTQKEVVATAQEVASEAIPAVETEVLSPTPQRSRNSQSEENDWTMVDNSAAPKHGQANIAAVANPAQQIDFAALSQQLQSDIENKIKENEMAQTQATVVGPKPIPVITLAPVADTPAAVPAPLAPGATEPRAASVFHPDPRINNAIQAMAAMGFSNEGSSLTQLMESVNGSIHQALEKMLF